MAKDHVEFAFIMSYQLVQDMKASLTQDKAKLEMIKN